MKSNVWAALAVVVVNLPMWIGYGLLKFVTGIAGLVVVPFLYEYRFTAYETVRKHWPLLRPWLNPEDWCNGPQSFSNSLPQWWVRKHGTTFWSFYRYHAIQNPANGLRSYRLLTCDVTQASRIRWIGTRRMWQDQVGEFRDGDKPLRYYYTWWVRKNENHLRFYWYLCWVGWKLGAKVVYHWDRKHFFTVKLGWRVVPSDAYEGPDPDGTRAKFGAGFAAKMKLYGDG